jgi:hypothetical protein
MIHYISDDDDEYYELWCFKQWRWHIGRWWHSQEKAQVHEDVGLPQAFHA